METWWGTERHQCVLPISLSEVLYMSFYKQHINARESLTFWGEFIILHVFPHAEIERLPHSCVMMRLCINPITVANRNIKVSRCIKLVETLSCILYFIEEWGLNAQSAHLEVEQNIFTLSGGSLGSCDEEEQSQLCVVMWIAERFEHRPLERILRSQGLNPEATFVRASALSIITLLSDGLREYPSLPFHVRRLWWMSL